MWEMLSRNSEKLSEPYIASSIPALPVTFSLIASALHGVKLSEPPGYINYFRGFISGREDYTLADSFLCGLVDEQVNIEELIDQSFGTDTPIYGKQAGLVINGCLQWSEELQERISCEAKKISQIFLGDLLTVDLTLFIGAYGSTPFGAHIDDASHHTILFNLGPYKKGIAIWDNDAIYDQFGHVYNIFKPSEILASPKQYYFNTGEAFVLPSRQFHLGLNNDVSTTAAFVIDLVDDGKAITKEAQAIFSDIDSYKTTQRDELMNLSAACLLDMYTLRTRSNSFLKYSPAPTDFNVMTLKRSSILTKTDSFCVETTNFKKSGIIYSRGRHMISPQHIDARDIRTIFKKNGLSVADFITYFTQKGLSIEGTIRLLRFLIFSRSVHIPQ